MTMSSSPGLIRPSCVAGIASVQPEVTVTSVWESILRPMLSSTKSAIALVSSVVPAERAYWL